MGFSAAGFFGQMNADITNQKQYIRARVEEDRLYLREQGLKRQSTIQEQRGQYEQAARSLITRGADERAVLDALEMDPAGLMEVFRRTDNNNDVTGANLNDIMSIAGDYRGESTMDEVLNSILPTIQEMPNDTGPVESRRRSIASWLGLDVDEAMTNQVYNQQIVGGMTGDQIMAGMNLPVQAQGSNVGGVNYDFSSLGSGNTMSATDVRAHISTINEELSIDGEVARLNQLINPEAGLPRPTTQEATDHRADIAALEEADSRSGANRINALLAIPGVEPGATTRMLIGLHGENLFSNTNGFNNPSLSILLGTSPEDTSEAAVNTSGDPAVDPVEGTTRPRARPDGAPVASTTAAVLEAARQALDNDSELMEVAVPIYGGGTSTVTRNELPVLSVEENDDRLNLLAVLEEGAGRNPAGTLAIANALEDYSAKYGQEAAEAVATMSPTPVVSPVSLALANAASRGAPQANTTGTPGSRFRTPTPAAPIPVPEIPVEEAIADQQMLQAAVMSTDIEQDELDTIMQNFIDRYGLEAARNVVSQTQNPG
jgi:hypothetical protein